MHEFKWKQKMFPIEKLTLFFLRRKLWPHLRAICKDNEKCFCVFGGWNSNVTGRDDKRRHSPRSLTPFPSSSAATAITFPAFITRTIPAVPVSVPFTISISGPFSGAFSGALSRSFACSRLSSFSFAHFFTFPRLLRWRRWRWRWWSCHLPMFPLILT